MAGKALLDVGFVGLGSMGGGMAANLAVRLPARRLVVFDAQHEVAAAFAHNVKSNRVHVARSLQDVSRTCSMVFLCLPNAAVSGRVVSSLAPGLEAGALVVECSTTGPAAAREAAKTLAATGLRFLDAPVTGAPARARAGTLTAMAGGCGQALEEARPLLASFAREVLHVGPLVGDGQVCKALNNCLYNVSAAAFAEVLPLAKAAGLDLGAFASVVSSGTGQSFAFDHFAPRAFQREFQAPRYGFPMAEAYKDFLTLEETAAALGAAQPVVAAARGTYDLALAEGLGHEHKGAMVKVWEKRLGVTCEYQNSDD